VSLFVTLKTGKVRKFETGNFAMASDNGHVMIVFARPGAIAVPLAFIPMVLVESVDVEDQAWPGGADPAIDEKVLAFFRPPAAEVPPDEPEPGPPKRAF
jgi:hypothetical protein